MENKTDSNIVIFYHNDADGIASAIVIYRMLKLLPISSDNTVLLPCLHGNKGMHIDCSRVDGVIDQMFVVDYSPSTEAEIRVLEEMENKDSLIFIDHHESSKLLISNNIIGSNVAMFTRTDKNVSAAVLCYAFAKCMLSNKKVLIDTYDSTLDGIIQEKIKLPDWIAFVSDNDTFTNAYEETKYFSLALRNMSNEEVIDFFLDISDELFKNNPPSLMEVPVDDLVYDMIDRGEIMYEYQAKLNEAIMKISSFECQIHLQIPRQFIDPDDTLGLPESIDRTGNFCCVNAYGNSRVFGKAYDENNGVIIFSYNGETYNYNAFSKDDGFQVNLLALYFKELEGLNGGGHYHAAGWGSHRNLFRKDGKYLLTPEGISLDK